MYSPLQLRMKLINICPSKANVKSQQYTTEALTVIVLYTLRARTTLSNEELTGSNIQGGTIQ